MNQSLSDGINDLADEVRRVFNITSPIGNIEDVVKTLGGSVEKCTKLENFADAKIEKIDNKSFKISILDFQSDSRKRFSIAHELGHLFLHMGYCIDDEMWNSNENNKFFRCFSGEKEFQAHEFAAAFLMPKREFKEQMAKAFNDEDYTYDMGIVAEYFNVSVEAAINRGRWLNMLNW